MDFSQNNDITKHKRRKLENSVERAICDSKKRRNLKRKLRRKRSKSKYYKLLKYHRVNRNTEDLCNSVTIFDLAEMDWTSTESCSSLPEEIVEWQNQHQLAYWKSRAISLELENKMLLQHLRNVYAKQIQDYSDYVHMENTNAVEQQKKVVNECSAEKPFKEVAAHLPQTKKRNEEMKQIYGNKADKIMGMETAVLLNYDRYKDQQQLKHWPNLPLNM